jgi:hypothetical protein
MAKRRGRDDNWSNLAIIGTLAAMVAVTAFTPRRNSPLIAARPQMTGSEFGDLRQRKRRTAGCSGTLSRNLP